MLLYLSADEESISEDACKLFWQKVFNCTPGKREMCTTFYIYKPLLIFSSADILVSVSISIFEITVENNYTDKI